MIFFFKICICEKFIIWDQTGSCIFFLFEMKANTLQVVKGALAPQKSFLLFDIVLKSLSMQTKQKKTHQKILIFGWVMACQSKQFSRVPKTQICLWRRVSPLMTSAGAENHFFTIFTIVPMLEKRSLQQIRFQFKKTVLVFLIQKWTRNSKIKILRSDN